MKPSVRGEIVDVVVESEYRGSVYERTVSVQTESGIIDCFEGKSHVTREDYGSTVDLVLLARPTSDIAWLEDVTPGIDQQRESEEGRSPWRCTLRGTVLHTDVSDSWLGGKYEPLPLIDIGIGSVLVAPNEQLSVSIEEGEGGLGSAVRIECSRLDIVGRNDGT